VNTPLVQLTEASLAFGDRVLWDSLELTIDPGEFVAILGPNGVGKSTLLKAVLGLIPLAAGQIRVLGRPAGQANREIGYLPQRHGFDPSLRIRGTDVVRLGVDGGRWGVPLPGARSRAAAERVRDLLRLVDAEGFAHRPIGQVSGGEQQRLLIAQALARRPALLLLDEPLDSLDLPNQAAIAALVARVCRERRVTVLMVAHDVNPILRYLDRVIYLGKGGAAAGTPSEVITSATLTALYGTTVEVLSTSDGQLAVIGQPDAPARHSQQQGAAR
jgi:zinc/manganese transport system ATP-binding protein